MAPITLIFAGNMLNSKKPFEKFLQRYRFRKVLPYLEGAVLDFGGNEGELEPYVAGEYTLVNYDHSIVSGRQFDTIVMLAVLEHIPLASVRATFDLFKSILSPDGKIFLTTPAPAAKPVLELLAVAGILDKENIAEHQHYWNQSEILSMSKEAGFEVVRYKKFQFGFNQLALLKHSVRVG